MTTVLLFIVLMTCIMSEEKFYSFGDSAGRSTLDPNLLLATMNNGGGFGGNGNWLWIVFLFFLNGWGGRGFGANDVNNDYARELFSQAIAGNRTAISELSTNLNCSVGQIQNALNAIQSNMANCCCEIKDSITKQGYENQLATVNQTNVLGGKIDAQTQLITDKFCDLEKRELQNKIDALRESNSTLKGQIDNAQQTAQITGYINQLVAPIAQDVEGIKCRLPEVAKVPYSPVVGVPTCVAYQSGLLGNGFTGFGGFGGFAGGNGFF